MVQSQTTWHVLKRKIQKFYKNIFNYKEDWKNFSENPCFNLIQKKNHKNNGLLCKTPRILLSYDKITSAISKLYTCMYMLAKSHTYRFFLLKPQCNHLFLEVLRKFHGICSREILPFPLVTLIYTPPLYLDFDLFNFYVKSNHKVSSV